MAWLRGRQIGRLGLHVKAKVAGLLDPGAVGDALGSFMSFLELRLYHNALLAV